MFIIYYEIFINILAFILYGIDKRRAIRGKYRIPEARLLGAAFIGGALGAWLGMLAFRHKTQKLKFKLVPVFLVLQVIAVGFLVYKLYFRI